MDNKLLAKLTEWRDDPVLFVREAFGVVDTPDHPAIEEWQEEGLRALALYDRLAIRSGHGIGKTCWLAWITWWWILTRHPFKVGITAPTAVTMDDALWPEIAMWGARLPEALQNLYDIKSSRIELIPESGMKVISFVTARTARPEKPEALQGLHSRHMLFLIDEACFDEETEILTDRGWLRFPDFQDGDCVLTMDPDSRVAFYEQPTAFYSKEWDGEMFVYETRAVDIKVTPNHRMFYGRRTSDGSYGTKKTDWRFGEVQDIKSHEIAVPRRFEWVGCEDSLFSIEGNVNRFGQVLAPLSFPMEEWVELLGWYLSEGSIGRVNGKAYSTVISQMNPENRVRIERCVAALGYKPGVYKHTIQLHDWRVAGELESCGKSLDKRVPCYVMDLPPRLIRIFLDAFLLGDGYNKDGKYSTYYTSSKGMADDLQELILKTGGYASVCVRPLEGKVTWIMDHYATSSSDGYVIKEFVSENAKVRMRNASWEHYKGMVYCVHVPGTHLVYVRRNGKCHWSGNSGVEDIIFETARGAMTTAGAKTVMTGNPTRPSGYFFDAFHKMANRWWLKHVPCSDSTRADPKFIKEMGEDYGVDSNVYRIRVLGEFPTADEDAVIPLDLIEAAVKRDIEPSVEDVLWGVDVARKGADRCALAKRTNTRLLEPVKWWRDKTITQTVGIIKHEWDTCYSWERPRLILVDAIGFGAGVGDDLRALGLPIKLVNVAELPGEADLYLRLRDELWFKARYWFEERACWIPDDRELISELSMVRFEYRSSGKMNVESKEEMKKRTSPRKSPDLADAFVITFASAGAAALHNIQQPPQTDSGYKELTW